MLKEKNYWDNYKFINDLINQLPTAIFWKNTESVFLGCNQYFADLAQVSSSINIIGKTDYDLPWGMYEGDSYIKDDQEIINSKLPKLNIEETQTLADGRVITLLTNKIPLFNNLCKDNLSFILNKKRGKPISDFPLSILTSYITYL